MNSTTNSTRQAIIERICLNVTDLRVLAVLNCTNTKSTSNQPITTWTDTAPTVIVNRRPSSTPVVASPTANVKTQDWNWGNVLTRSNYSIMIVLIVTFVAALCAIFISFACKRRRSKDNVKELVERGVKESAKLEPTNNRFQPVGAYTHHIYAPTVNHAPVKSSMKKTRPPSNAHSRTQTFQGNYGQLSPSRASVHTDFESEPSPVSFTGHRRITSQTTSQSLPTHANYSYRPQRSHEFHDQHSYARGTGYNPSPLSQQIYTKSSSYAPTDPYTVSPVPFSPMDSGAAKKQEVYRGGNLKNTYVELPDSDNSLYTDTIS